MAPLREEGTAAERETVNKVCREGKLCPCQHSMPVSPSFSVPLSASPQRIKKMEEGGFSESKLSKLERQHEFSGTEK